VGEKEPSYTDGGNVTTSLENNMEVSLKTKHISAILSSNPTPRDIPERM
jgi:hypothetical protein